MVPIKPNKSHIDALVKNYTIANDGFGGWADLILNNISDVEGETNFLQETQIGTEIKVFVSPKIQFSPGDNYSGEITYNGDEQGGIYVLIPPR